MATYVGSWKGEDPFVGAVVLTSGVAITSVVRSIGYVCTAGGTATLALPDGSTIAIPLAVNAAFQTLPFAATMITLSGGAAGIFWGLK